MRLSDQQKQVYSKREQHGYELATCFCRRVLLKEIQSLVSQVLGKYRKKRHTLSTDQNLVALLEQKRTILQNEVIQG